MKNPPHPGGALRYDIEAMGWTVAECARRLGLSRTTLSRVLNGKQGVTPAVALSLERLGWSDADTWMRLQSTYDLAQERRRHRAAWCSASAAATFPRLAMATDRRAGTDRCLAIGRANETNGVYDRSLVRMSAPSRETQAFRLHAGETPALPAPVTKDLSYTQTNVPCAKTQDMLYNDARQRRKST